MAIKTLPGVARRKARSPAPVLVSTKSDGGAATPSRARDAMIAEAAYYRAARRGFVPGHELDDWLAAERQVDSALIMGESPPS
jgi:hypothetical protein